MKQRALYGVYVRQGRWIFGAKFHPYKWIVGIQLAFFNDGDRLMTVHFGPIEFAIWRKAATT